MGWAMCIEASRLRRSLELLGHCWFDFRVGDCSRNGGRVKGDDNVILRGRLTFA